MHCIKVLRLTFVVSNKHGKCLMTIFDGKIQSQTLLAYFYMHFIDLLRKLQKKWNRMIIDCIFWWRSKKIQKECLLYIDDPTFLLIFRYVAYSLNVIVYLCIMELDRSKLLRIFYTTINKYSWSKLIWYGKMRTFTQIINSSTFSLNISRLSKK